MCSVNPAGQFATCLHTGPYSDVGAAYEVYLNDLDETPSEELRTQIMFRVK